MYTSKQLAEALGLGPLLTKICKVLVEKHGLEAAGKDMFAQTPLFAAAKRGDIELSLGCTGLSISPTCAESQVQLLPG